MINTKNFIEKLNNQGFIVISDSVNLSDIDNFLDDYYDFKKNFLIQVKII
jgi:hypothetical protein